MKKKIFIIDDDLDLMMLMEHVFLSTGLYDVVAAYDGKDGRRKVAQEDPDVIFLGCSLEGAAENDLLKLVLSRSSLDHAAVVMMNGSGGMISFGTGRQDCESGDRGSFSDCLSGDFGTMCFPGGVIQAQRVTRVLSKPFSCKKLLRVTAEILGQPDGGGLQEHE